MHEEVRRGSRGASSPPTTRAEPPRGEVVLVVAAAPPGSQPDAQERASRRCARSSRPARGRGRRRRSLAELTGVPANRLYNALTERDEPSALGAGRALP